MSNNSINTLNKGTAIKTRDLIVFGEDWGGLPSSTQHLISFIAENRKVLWVNSIGLRSPKFSIHDTKRIARKLSSFVLKNHGAADLTTSSKQSVNTAIPSNMRVINPLTIPAPRSSTMRKLAAYLLRKQIMPVAREMGLYSPILWSSLPTAADLVNGLDESAVVYYCGDDFSGLNGVDHATVSQHEKKLSNSSDLIITASKQLAEKFPCYKTRELTHGVDFNLFSKPVPRAEDMPNTNKPIAGFYGSLSNWLDIELLVRVIKALPHWEFVFIGEKHTNMLPLEMLNNTHFLGPKPHHELPKYSTHWNASLLPFRDNQQIRSCNPLKLYEYLAAGKPIIATDFPALAPYKDIVQCVRNSHDFIVALQNSLHLERNMSFKKTSQKRVENNTWQHKAYKVSMWMDAL